MKKPKKLVGSGNSSENQFGFGRVIGYNQCWDDREKWLKEFLPSEDEIGFLLFKTWNRYDDEVARELWTAKHEKMTTKAVSTRLAQAIHSCLIGEKE